MSDDDKTHKATHTGHSHVDLIILRLLISRGILKEDDVLSHLHHEVSLLAAGGRKEAAQVLGDLVEVLEAQLRDPAQPRPKSQ